MMKLINEFNNFEKDIIIKEDEYIIFGTGEASKELVKILGKKPRFFLDNDKSKYNERFFDREIKSPNILLHNDYKDIIIIASMYYKEISIQLDKLIGERKNIYYNLQSIEEILYNHIKSMVDSINDIDEKIQYLVSIEDEIYNVKSANYIKDMLYNLRVSKLKKYIAENTRKKNVIIYHLESISQQVLRNNLEYFNTLNKLQKQSINLTKFFSNTTSTYMAMSSFFYGNDFELDRKHSLHDDIPVSNIEENIFSILEKENYRTLSTIYWDDADGINNLNISHNKTHKSKNSYRDFMKSIYNFIDEEEYPFAIYITDVRTHLAYQNLNKPDEMTPISKLKWGYRNVDKTLDSIMQMLKERDILKDTIIICYGDHGDDYWTHNFNNGYAHSIEPYSNIIHTPAFIYCENIPHINFEGVCSTINIKNTILYLLGIEEKNKFKYSGKSIFDNDGYAYSQNLLANQYVNKNNGLNKSYSITNDTYNLIVSNEGLEMYAYEIDPYNHNNLLNFFEFKHNYILKQKNFEDANYHFKALFNKVQISDILSNFYLLVDLLKKRVIEKNKMANENKFDLNNFNRIKRREYKW